MKIDVTTYYLEMTDRSEIRRSQGSHDEFRIRRAFVPSPELNRYLYTAVGGDWHWTDRLGWNHARWLDYLSRSELETWVGYLTGTPAGYFELELQARGNVEIAYFGLLPGFVGLKLGGALLTRCIERAWEMGAARVWVHTCTLDHPAALANYRARGMRIYKEETVSQRIDPAPPGPWPGADRKIAEREDE